MATNTSTTSFEQLIERLDVTRARIDAQLNGPTVINVAAARDEDGSAALATVLAHSFTQAGHSTLLVEGRFRVAGQAVLPIKLDHDVFTHIRQTRKGSPDLLNLSTIHARSAAELRELYALLRSQYSITIGSSSLQGSPSTISLASFADLVLISFKKGRAAGDDDRELSELLRGAGTPVLGVILMQADAIKVATTIPPEVAGRPFTEPDGPLPRTAMSARLS